VTARGVAARIRVKEILTCVLLLDLGGGLVLCALYLPLENLGAAGALHVLPLTLALVGPVPNLQYSTHDQFS